MILDGAAPNFDRSRVMAPINTASRWPRSARARSRSCTTPSQPQPFKLPHFMTTELEHYHGLRVPLGAMLFHGTLNATRTIDQLINFDLGGGAMGPGFYLTSNPNEAKAYAIERLRQARDPTSDRFIDDWDVDTRGGVHHHRRRVRRQAVRARAAPGRRRPWAQLDADVALNAAGNAAKTFYHNPGDQRFNQFVLHRSCALNLIVVGVHDIHLTGDFQHTGINDARHRVSFSRGLNLSQPWVKCNFPTFQS